ncbi:MAG: pullulanase [Rhodobacteraceae bacterium]|jgi:putative photosynthetic complex assembly protein|nr:pullulanase [Paracoccaceae bacterium]
MADVRYIKKDEETIPKVALWAMFSLVLVVLFSVTMVRVFDVPAVATPPASPIKAEVPLYIYGQQSGAVRVLDQNGTVLAEMTGEKGGFISGVARVIERERARAGMTMDAPVHVIWRENNRLSLLDPQTGWQADLMGFGADNSRAFANLVAKAMKGN